MTARGITLRRSTWRNLTAALSAATLALMILATGCLDQDGGGDGTDTEPTGQIKSITVNIRVSGDQMVTVLYDAGPAGAGVEAFYVEVDSTAADASTVGLDVVFGQNLPTGENQTVNLETAALPQGIYRVGLNVTSAGQTLRVMSLGTIEVTTLPDPVFVLPNQNVIDQPGTNISVAANVGDPENAVQWRLFYIPAGERPTDDTPNEYGTSIATGAANVASATWFTAGVPLGEYELGIFVTDSGQSIADTVAAGDLDLIRGPFFNEFTVTLTDAPPQTIPPSVVVTEPASDQNILLVDPNDPNEGNVQVKFAVTVFQGPPSLQYIDVFKDFDGEPATGDESLVSGSLPITATSAVFRVGTIEAGTTAFIGVTAHDGVSSPVTRYAAGRVRRLSPSEAALEVTQPSSPLKRNVGETVNVAWHTINLPTDAPANQNVYIRRVDAAGNPIGTIETTLPKNTTPIPLGTTTFNYATDSPGRFMVTVEVKYTTGTTAPIRQNAPSLVVVSSIPDIIWLGGLDPTPPYDKIPAQLDGAIFEGIQFEDNAGSAFAGAEDFDGDGLDEVLIVARYGKPFFRNPSGVGPGEAYLLRGRATRYGGVLNLNTVASPTIPGLVFAGLPVEAFTFNPAASPDDTDGLANIFITTTSSDGDAAGEVVFTFPWTRTRAVGELGGPGTVPVLGNSPNSPDEFCPLLSGVRDPDGWEIAHFLRGGAIIFSSRNTALSSKNGDGGGTRIDLEDVGQIFAETEVIPEYDDGDLCTGESDWTEDREAWVQDDACPTGANGTGGAVGCEIGDDDIADTLVRPRIIDPGFDYGLSDPFVCNAGYFRFLDQCGALLSENCPASDTTCFGATFCTGCFLTENPSCDNDQFSTDPFCSSLRCLCEAGLGEPACDPPFVDDCDGQKDKARDTMPVGQFRWGFGSTLPYGTGVYPRQIGAGEWNEPFDNTIGARVLGRNNFDGLGVTVTQSGSYLILTSKFAVDSPFDDGGVGYMRPFSQEWALRDDIEAYVPGDQPNGLLNRPYQSQVATPFQDPSSGQPFQKGIRGDDDELIETIVAIPDFNEDTRSDIAVGAPLADVNNDTQFDGAVYILFRRASTIEGIYDVADLKRNTSDPERLSGVLIRETFSSGQRFGISIAGDFDFNHDGKPDVVIGNPDGNNGTGEIVVIFSDRNLITQQDGLPIEDEAGPPVVQGVLSRGSGLRIKGVEIASEFGLFVANIGDLDGDGLNDLAIAAPNATPMFDSNPNDNVDVLDSPGLDGVVDSDGNGTPDAPNGVRDNVAGPLGFPDFAANGTTPIIDANDELRHAGLVYIILGSSFEEAFDANPNAKVDLSISKLGTSDLDGFIIVGRRGDRFPSTDPTGLNPPSHEGDFLAGGDMGEAGTRTLFGKSIRYGGIAAKAPEDVLDATTGVQRTAANGTPLMRQRGQAFAIGRAGDVDGDGSDELLLGSPLADPRVDPRTGVGTRNGGEAYLIYGFKR